MLLIDSMMLIRRCFAKMDFLKSQSGVPTGMEFGTLRTVEMLQKKYPAQHMVFCFDSPKSVRKDRHPEYKANRKREMSDDFYSRLAEFKRFVQAIFYTCECEGYEADDVMYSLATRSPGGHLIYTNDKDLLQAVGKNVSMIKSFKSKLYVWDSAKVMKEFGVSPNLFATYQAFVGDKVDNVTGVLRIPKKLLSALILWCHGCKMNQLDMLQEMRTADWSEKMRQRVIEFIDSGQFARNWDMVKLKVLLCLFVKPPISDKKFIKHKLQEWDIHTLKLCKGHVDLENEEF